MKKINLNHPQLIRGLKILALILLSNGLFYLLWPASSHGPSEEKESSGSGLKKPQKKNAVYLKLPLELLFPWDFKSEKEILLYFDSKSGDLNNEEGEYLGPVMLVSKGEDSTYILEVPASLMEEIVGKFKENRILGIPYVKPFSKKENDKTLFQGNSRELIF
jgi:hypothetical protein